jgi:hypothetical protein
MFTNFYKFLKEKTLQIELKMSENTKLTALYNISQSQRILRCHSITDVGISHDGTSNCRTPFEPIFSLWVGLSETQKILKRFRPMIYWRRVMTVLLNFRPIYRHSKEHQIMKFWSEILPIDSLIAIKISWKFESTWTFLSRNIELWKNNHFS